MSSNSSSDSEADESKPSGINLTGFLFGNIDSEGNLQQDGDDGDKILEAKQLKGLEFLLNKENEESLKILKGQ